MSEHSVMTSELCWGAQVIFATYIQTVQIHHSLTSLRATENARPGLGNDGLGHLKFCK